MSKKPAITRRYLELPKPYFIRAISEMKSQTDLGTAIVGSAFLDLILRHAIESKFCDDDELKCVLFENRGALQDFSARIQLAYALGIVKYRAYADMCVIRNIRNAAAHSAEAFGFDRDDVATLCSSLWFADKIIYGKREKPTNAREMFIREIELLCDGLTANIARPPHFAPDTFVMMGPPKPEKRQSSPKRPKPRSHRGDPTGNRNKSE